MSELAVAAAATTTPSGDQKTLGQMATDVATFFGLDKNPEKDAFIRRVIHSIIDDLNRKKLWGFNLITASDFSSVAGQATYSLASIASNLWRVYNLRKSSGVDYTLTGIRESLFDTLFQSQSGITGFPYVRVNFNIYRDGTLKLFPTPDAVYTFTLRYFRLIPHPNGDGTFLDMPSPYQSVVEYGACARIAALSNSETLGYWQGLFDRSYEEMNEMDENQGDEDLRLINIEEMDSRAAGWANPGLRPRFLDLY